MKPKEVRAQLIATLRGLLRDASFVSKRSSIPGDPSFITRGGAGGRWVEGAR